MNADEETAWITEICNDAAAHPDRLTAWENSFIAEKRQALAAGWSVVLSEKQREVFTRIERKLYGT